MNNTIEEIIDTAFLRLKNMADADTVVGKPIETADGGVVIPVSKVSVGFVAGGGEYSEVTLAGKKPEGKDFPFAGGSGAGLCVTPVAFVVVADGETKMFAIDQKSPMQKLWEMVPEVVRNGLDKLGLKVDSKSTVIEQVDEKKEDK